MVSRFRGDVYSLFASGGVGLPSGLSQNPLESTVPFVEEEESGVFLNPTLAVQKLVSFMDLS